MRNIFAIIKKFYVFLLFLVLQILSIALLVDSTNYQRTQFLEQANSMVGQVYSRRARLSEYLRLGEINDQLSLENALLRSRLTENYLIERAAADTVRDTLTRQRFTYRTAKVVNASVNRMKNYLVLDRGYASDVQPKMSVIANGAIVGIVRSVTENFAVVMPVLHTDFKASVRLKRSGVDGSLVWSGGNPAIAEVIDIPKNIPVEVGDTIITSGHSRRFPANLLAGRVVEVNDEDNDYHLIRIELGADFRKLDHVLVVGDLYREEIQQALQQVDPDAATDID